MAKAITHKSVPKWARLPLQDEIVSHLKACHVLNVESVLNRYEEEDDSYVWNFLGNATIWATCAKYLKCGYSECMECVKLANVMLQRWRDGGEFRCINDAEKQVVMTAAGYWDDMLSIADRITYNDAVATVESWLYRVRSESRAVRADVVGVV